MHGALHVPEQRPHGVGLDQRRSISGGHAGQRRAPIAESLQRVQRLAHPCPSRQIAVAGEDLRGGQQLMLTQHPVVESLEVEHHFAAGARHSTPRAPSDLRAGDVAEGQHRIEPDRPIAVATVHLHLLDRVAFDDPIALGVDANRVFQLPAVDVEGRPGGGPQVDRRYAVHRDQLAGHAPRELQTPGEEETDFAAVFEPGTGERCQPEFLREGEKLGDDAMGLVGGGPYRQSRLIRGEAVQAQFPGRNPPRGAVRGRDFDHAEVLRQRVGEHGGAHFIVAEPELQRRWRPARQPDGDAVCEVGLRIQSAHLQRDRCRDQTRRGSEADQRMSAELVIEARTAGYQLLFGTAAELNHGHRRHRFK